MRLNQLGAVQNSKVLSNFEVAQTDGYVDHPGVGGLKPNASVFITNQGRQAHRMPDPEWFYGSQLTTISDDSQTDQTSAPTQSPPPSPPPAYAETAPRPSETTSKTEEQPRVRKVRSDLTFTEMFWEFKNHDLSPFEDPPLPGPGKTEEEVCADHDILKPCHDNAPNSSDKQLALGQPIAYGSFILGCQYRTFCYGLLVCGEEARILRFDRTGCVVTRAMNIQEEEGARNLFEFFWRFNHATPAQRGFDLSVAGVTAAEEEAFV